MNRDTLQVVLSDLHSGSNYALFVNRAWRGEKDMTRIPSSKQQAIRRVWDEYIEIVKRARKNKRVILVHNGDAIDGDHHNSSDVCSRSPLNQADIHIELMNEFQKRIGWQRGDEIYYTRGTQTHVNEYEDYIGREMNAVMDGEYHVFDLLKLKTNGVVSWFVHHGPGRGAGANEGSPMRAWLKNIYHEATKDHTAIPDIVYTGHVHNPTYNDYIYRDKMNFRIIHGVILPSWQMKTKYAWEKASVSVNKIGGVVHEIKADGTICLPIFCAYDVS